MRSILKLALYSLNLRQADFITFESLVRVVIKKTYSLPKRCSWNIGKVILN